MKLTIKTDEECIKCRRGKYVRTKISPTTWRFVCNHCHDEHYRYEQAVPHVTISKQVQK